MNSSIESLYHDLIFELSRRPHGQGLESKAWGESRQMNTVCGDEVTVQVFLEDGSDRVRAVRWEGRGCAISMASASIFSDLAPGLTVSELASRIDLFTIAMRSRGMIQPDELLLGDAIALGGVSRYISRVRCATLAWVAGEAAIRGHQDDMK